MKDFDCSSVSAHVGTASARSHFEAQLTPAIRSGRLGEVQFGLFASYPAQGSIWKSYQYVFFFFLFLFFSLVKLILLSPRVWRSTFLPKMLRTNPCVFIADPDLSNPTRPRLERPLDTIRSFEAAIYGTYTSQRPNSYARTGSLCSARSKGPQADYDSVDDAASQMGDFSRRTSYYGEYFRPDIHRSGPVNQQNSNCHSNRSQSTGESRIRRTERLLRSRQPIAP